MVLPFVLVLAACCFEQAAGDRLPARLIFEGAGKPHFSRTDDYVELRAGRGWLLIPEVYTDLDMTFEFRLTDPTAEADLVLANMPRGEVRLRLPSSNTRPDRLVRDKDMRITALPSASLPSIDDTAWHTVRIRMKDGDLSFTLDKTEVSRVRIERFVGHAGFRTDKGGVQLRWIFPDTPAWRLGIVKEDDPGIEGPRLLTEVKPDYTAEAMRGKVEGIVIVGAVVMTDGTVGAVQMLRRLPAGLDRMAVEAVRKWRFEPATRNGQPVPCWVTIDLNFRIK